MEDLERQVRRRLIGRTILDICLDLAVVPGICTAPFWAALSEMMHCLGGDVATLMQQKSHRREAFIQEQSRQPASNWDWLRLQRDAIRQVLGFFIGEPPVNPLAPEAATAPDPPGSDAALTQRDRQQPAPPLPMPASPRSGSA